MKRKKALLFPYDTSLLHMVIHRKTIKEYEIVSVASLKSWGYCGFDAGVKLGISTGVIVTDDFGKALSEVDTVIIPDTNISLENEWIDRYTDKIKSAGKEILDIRLKWLKSNKNCIIEKLNNNGTDEIKDINKPLIMVIGTGANTGKFDIQLSVREAFLSEGYRVSQIGSKPYCELWGFHSFPDFMTGTLEGREKIVKFNQYINYIANTEDSDVVIVGVPGGVVPISNRLFDDFGLMNYMVANAVKPDYVILNSGFVDYNKQYIETIVNALKYKLDYQVDCVFLSNYYINWEVTDSLDRLVYTTLPVKVTDRAAKACGCYSLYNKRDFEKFKSQMLSTLVGYSDFCAI